MSLFERGPQGTAGPPGKKGNSYYSGSGIPSVDLGSNGDHYFDKVGIAIYGPKANGVWGSPVLFDTTFVPPTGTGFVTCTSGAVDGAATGNARYVGGKIQTDSNIQWRNTGDSNRTGDLVWAPTTSAKTLTLPNATDTLVGKATTDSLSNKTLVLPKIADSGSHNYIFAVSNLVADRTVTLPLLTADDTLIFATFAATLSNKTLASPVISGTPVYPSTNFRIFPVIGGVATSSTGQTIVVSYTMVDESHCQFDAITTCARKTNVTKAGTWKRAVAYRRTGGGAPQIVGAPEPGTDEETTPADDVTFTLSGNTISVSVTAADSDPRNWGSEMRVQETLAI